MEKLRWQDMRSFSVRLPEEVHVALDTYCSKHRKVKRDVVEKALKDFLGVVDNNSLS